MARLSVTEAWNETVAFVKAEARLLFPLAFMAVALPAAVLRAIVPLTSPGDLPPAGPWLIWAAVTMILALIGNLAISYLAIRPGVSVKEALTRAAARAPVLLLAALLVSGAAVAFIMLAAILIGMLFAGAAMSSGGTPTPEQLAPLTLALVVVVIPVLVYFAARLMMMTPAAVGERGGPFSLISRSWALTRGHALKLVALILILLGVSFVLQIAVQSLFGIAFAITAGRPEPGSVGAIATLLALAALNTLVAVYAGSLIAKVYTQLSSSGT